jgi:uncharacterized protein (DUF433 family)
MNTIEHNYISINPEVRFGKPCISGTRISVYDILIWLASGMSFQDILDDFPELNQQQLQAALSFAAFREQAIKSIKYETVA